MLAIAIVPIVLSSVPYVVLLPDARNDISDCT